MTGALSHIVLFNDVHYQCRNLRPGQHPFRYDHLVKGRLIGTLSGVIDGGILDCGHSAPFGGIDYMRSDVSAAAVTDLLRGAVCRARTVGVREVFIRGRPGYFGANEAVTQFALFNSGARVARCELSLGLEARRFATADHYAAALDHSARKQLRQGLAAGFDFAAANTVAEWSECFDLLVETRRRRGATMKISLAYVTGLREVFGSRITMHRLLAGGALAGAALVYRVRRDWDYIVAWGDDLAQRSKRVMNVLAYRLVCAAIAEQVGVVDLGVSSVDGVPDEGLIHFKRGIGAVPGLRLDFRVPVS